MRISDWSSDVCSSDLADLAATGGKILVKIVDDDAAASGPSGTTLLGREAAHIVLDGVKQGDAAQHPGSDRGCISQFVEFATHMRPADIEPDLLAPPRERGVAAIRSEERRERKEDVS